MSTQTLREAREAARLTQDELSAKSGVAQATISQIECGLRTNPTIDTATRLADALGVSLVTLRFSDEEQAKAVSQ